MSRIAYCEIRNRGAYFRDVNDGQGGVDKWHCIGAIKSVVKVFTVKLKLDLKIWMQKVRSVFPFEIWGETFGCKNFFLVFYLQVELEGFNCIKQF
ncbi:hypothetical protein I4U23_000032 [Adineta vaga]|nr:hypothetical protein I4U23_000032 [Adineta vaga]